MKVDRRALNESLKQLNRVASPKATVPILSSVKLEADGTRLVLTANDLDQALTVEVPAEGELRVCLPAKLLYQLVKCTKKTGTDEVALDQLPDDRVALTVESMTTEIQGYPVADFPESPAVNAEDWSLVAIWPSEPLVQALSFVLPAASSDETRMNLNSVNFCDGHLVATDGHRMHLSPLPAPVPEPMLLPSATAEMLRRILSGTEQVIVARSGELVRFKVGAWQLDTRLMDEQFPKVDQVIPDSQGMGIRLTIDPAVFTKALGQLVKLSPDKSVKFTVNGKVTVEAFDPDTGSAELTVPTLQNTHTGDDLVVGFNAGYLLEALKKAQAPVSVSLVDPLSPMRLDLEEGGRLAVVMPLRV